MFEITVIGLGVDGCDLTSKSENLIKSSVVTVARTGLTESFKNLKALNKDIKTLDFIYEKSRNFDTLNKNLATHVLNLSKSSPVCYLVDGCAMEDNSVKYILKKAKNVKVIAGVSATTKCLERLNLCLSKYTAISSYELENGITLTAPLIVNAIDSAIIAGKIKLVLSELFGEESDVFVASNTYTKKIKLYELDRLKNYDYSLSLYIPELSLTKKSRYDFNDLMKILQILRAPNGCPWDREQTEKSILNNVIEEAYELVDAVNSGDDYSIVEETGDLILQSAFFITFGEEQLRYSRSDVLSDLCSKLITRHTHVFGSDKALASNDALNVWNNNKITEKGYETATDYLKAVPNVMPSLMRAQKIQKRASKYGFDFENHNQAVEKINEEILELKSALKKGDKEEIVKECGDLVFSAVNVVRLLGVDAELSLKYSVDKFIKRFSRLETEIKNRHLSFSSLSSSQIDDIYNAVKKGENDAN